MTKWFFYVFPINQQSFKKSLTLKKIFTHTALISIVMWSASFSISYAETKKRHALSLIGTPKYGPDYKHFDYVNPDAPKGGRVRRWAIGSFDTLNPFATTKGQPATGITLIYDQLMQVSLEEPSTEYGLLAEWVSYPDDFSSATFKLRDGATWHDGKPVTVEDVIFSFNNVIKINPRQAQYYKNVSDVKKTGDREVTFSFDTKNNRELPQIISQLYILPKHYWTDKDKDGKPRDISKSTLEIPLGSGPYKISSMQPGRSITYERVKKYWGKDLSVNKGQFNFDEIRFTYFRDPVVAFEAFKAGQVDYHIETRSLNWAKGYNFPAAKKGFVKKRYVPEKSVRFMQAFVFNTRLPKFSDARVRKALNLVFDFETANKNLFYGQYTRLNSFFDETEMAAKGLPQGKELEILNEFKGQIPEQVFTTEFKAPVNGNPQNFRKNLRQALKLLKEAGWVIKNKKLVNAKSGEPMEISFLLVSPAFERIVLPYIKNLERLGIKSSARVIDSSEYTRRKIKFEYEIIVDSFPQSFSPGNEQRFFWGSKAADTPGTRNAAGIKNPVVDKIIDKIIFAKDRPELVAATRALDRVLLWNYYVVPQWYSAYDRIAFWSKFGYPKSLVMVDKDCDQTCKQKKLAEPGNIYTLNTGFLQTWWYDEAKAKKIKDAR
ncbi:MAG: extracellular solute-binding protein [Pseudomonadota bacterium]